MGDDRPHLPRLRLDRLLDELQVQLDTARGTQSRVYALLEAVLSVGSELELPQVLRTIVESAATLVDAEYGALGVIDGTRMSEFLTVGVGDGQHKAIGPLPSGHGILGVPIRVRGDEVFGNLYLTQKRGGGEFDGEDETVLRTLALAAGVAIENARLYRSARDRQRWMEANAEIVAALLSGADEMDVLERIVRHARNIADADLGVIALAVEGGSDLRVMIAEGTDADDHRGLVLPRAGSFMGAAMTAGEPITSAEIRKDPRASAGPARFTHLGPAVAVPMVTDEGVRGALLLAREDGAVLFSLAESVPLLGFAGQAALALQLAEQRRSAEQLAVLEDRDRIARDLHDLAIQRLFATGMTLQSTLRFVDRPEASERLLRAVDDLDETIKIIRSTIFGLRAEEAGRRSRGLRSRAVVSVEEAAPALGFTPALHMEGLLDTDVPPAVVEDAVAVLAEALANAARHAQATAVEVALAVADRTLAVCVTDNGIGLRPGGRRSGLRNLAVRAERRGGCLDITPGHAGGTRLLWKVPLALPGA